MQHRSSAFTRGGKYKALTFDRSVAQPCALKKTDVNMITGEKGLEFTWGT
jgi:hypothetical protein